MKKHLEIKLIRTVFSPQTPVFNIFYSQKISAMKTGFVSLKPWLKSLTQEVWCTLGKLCWSHISLVIF